MEAWRGFSCSCAVGVHVVVCAVIRCAVVAVAHVASAVHADMQTCRHVVQLCTGCAVVAVAVDAVVHVA